MLSFIWKKPKEVNVADIERRLGDIETQLQKINDSIQSKKSIFTNPNAQGSPYTIHAFAHQTIKTVTLNNVNVGWLTKKIKIEPDPAIGLKYKQPTLIVVLEVFDVRQQSVANDALLTITYSNKIDEYQFSFNKGGDYKITMAIFWNRNN